MMTLDINNRTLVPGSLYTISISELFIEWEPYKNALLTDIDDNIKLHFQRVNPDNVLLFISFVSNNDFYKLLLKNRGFINPLIPMFICGSNHNTIIPLSSGNKYNIIPLI